MKKYLSVIVSAAALVVAAVSLFRISALKGELSQLEGIFASRISLMEANYNDAVSYVRETMERQATILAAESFTYGETDFENYTVELDCRVTPKVHQPGITQACIKINGEEYPMLPEDGAYTTAVRLPLFENVIIEQVVFQEGDTVRTEILDFHMSPRHDVLPGVSARLNGSGHGGVNGGTYVWSRTGEVSVTVRGNGRAPDIRSVSLIEELDGAAVGSTEIPLSNTKSRDAAAEEPALPADGAANDSVTFYLELERDFSIPFGSTLDLFAEVEYENGLRCRVPVDHMEIDENGRFVDDTPWAFRSLYEQITDSDGHILFEVNEDNFVALG